MRLIVNADDFGLTPGINRAIVELHQAGVLSSASLMASAPATGQAIDLALAHPGLGVGCHLVFVDGTPLSPPRSIPTLLGGDGKTFRRSLFAFAAAALRKQLNPDELARETFAQIEHLQRAGVKLRHIDTHKHTHMLPLIATAILPVAQRCGIQAVRYPFEPLWSIACAQASLLRRLQLRMLGRFAPAFRRLILASRRQVYRADATLGIAATGSLDAGVLRATLLAALSDHPAATYELCCHPGYDDSTLASLPTRLRACREIEYRALLEVMPQIMTLANAPSLIQYGDLVGRGP